MSDNNVSKPVYFDQPGMVKTIGLSSSTYQPSSLFSIIAVKSICLFVRLKFLERSDKKFVSRTIPLKAEGIIPRCSAAEFGSRACPGVHTRDSFWVSFYKFEEQNYKKNVLHLVKFEVRIILDFTLYTSDLTL
jgi:hypothetical protein